jgi:hypothetical protein
MELVALVARAFEIAEARQADHRMRGTVYVPACHQFIYTAVMGSPRVVWFIVPVN